MGASPFIQVYSSSVPILKQPKGLWQGNPVVQGHHQYLMRRAILAAKLSLFCQNLRKERIREHLNVSILYSSTAFPTVQRPILNIQKSISLVKRCQVCQGGGQEVGTKLQHESGPAHLTRALELSSISDPLSRVTFSSSRHHPPIKVVKPHQSPSPQSSHRLLLLLSELAGAMPLVHPAEIFSHLLAEGFRC